MPVSSITSSPLFEKGLYTIYTTDENGNQVVVDGKTSYGIDAVYTVSLNYTVNEVPLALLFAVMQIGLADIASYQAESYMQHIRDNQEAQIAAKEAIADLETWLEYTFTSITSGSDFVAANPDYKLVTNLTDGIPKTFFEHNDVYAIMTGDLIVEYGSSYQKYSVVLNDGSTGTAVITVAGGMITYAQDIILVSSVKLTSDVVDACILVGIEEIDGVPISTTDDDGVVSYASLNEAQLETLLEELELAQENTSTTTQTDMLYAEEYLGQFNSYLSGGSSSIDTLNSALQGTAQRI